MKSGVQSDDAKNTWFNGGPLWGKAVHPSIFCGFCVLVWAYDIRCPFLFFVSILTP